MRILKFLFLLVILSVFLFVLWTINNEVLIPIDERFENLDPLFLPIGCFLGSFSGSFGMMIFIKKDLTLSQKNKRNFLLMGIITILIECVIAFFAAPTDGQAFFLVVLGSILWGVLIFVFGSDDLKDIDWKSLFTLFTLDGLHRKDKSNIPIIGIIVILAVSAIAFIVTPIKEQIFFLVVLGFLIWGMLLYMFGSDDWKTMFTILGISRKDKIVLLICRTLIISLLGVIIFLYDLIGFQVILLLLLGLGIQIGLTIFFLIRGLKSEGEFGRG